MYEPGKDTKTKADRFPKRKNLYERINEKAKGRKHEIAKKMKHE